MKAAILTMPGPVEQGPLSIEDVPMPVVEPGFALLKVLACGIYRTDLHIIEGELPPKLPWVIPGHEVVAEVVQSSDPAFPAGARAGVSWIGGTDGICRFCQSGRENLCDNPIYTGYTHHGGYAQYATARSDFLHHIPDSLEPASAAPLLCAGMIGYRSLHIAEVKKGQKVGLFGFGSCAQILIHVLHAWDCRVYVSTREERHQQLARELGAVWAGGGDEVPPTPLNCAISFAPAGEVVVTALKSVDKGGIVAINAIHMDHMPQFDYDSIFWGERQLRSVTNMTRQDACEFLKIAADIGLKPEVDTYDLKQVNEALCAQKADRLNRTAVLLPHA
jgi:propanol-preferring alcohol dehydrogenase